MSQLDLRIVSANYCDAGLRDIVEDIVARTALGREGYTVGRCARLPMFAQIAFHFKSVPQAFDALAVAAACTWSVDDEKRIHFDVYDAPGLDPLEALRLNIAEHRAS